MPKKTLPATEEKDGWVQSSLYMLEECLRSAFSSIFAHGLRSLLTMLGIIIGVASVICVIALVQGLSLSISSQFQSLGGNTLTVRADTPLQDALLGKVNHLTISDLDQLQYQVEGIKNVTPTVTSVGNEVRNGATTTTALMLGTTEHYQDVQQTFPKHGRFLTESDNVTRRRVVVIGEQVRRNLKLPGNPSGHYIQISGEWFKIVGAMEPRGEMFGMSQDNYLLMPYQTALAVTGVITEPDLSISFSVVDLNQVDSIKQRVTALLRQQHRLESGQGNNFVVEASDTLAKSFKELTTTVTLVVAGVVSISLLVGGIGIMNIMLVSVIERTREIGIAKALGASRQFILIKFLIEAMALSIMGGLIGIVIGYMLGFGIAKSIPNFPDPSVPWWALVGACGFSSLIGVVFGILPASNAANLVPIEALRYE